MTVKCPTCGHDSDCPWRCDECRRDLATESPTEARQRVE